MKISDLCEDVFDATSIFQKKRDTVARQHQLAHKYKDMESDYKQKSYPIKDPKIGEQFYSKKVKEIEADRNKAMLKYRLQLAPLFKDYGKASDFYDVLAQFLYRGQDDDARIKMASDFVEQRYDEISTAIKISIKALADLRVEMKKHMEHKTFVTVESRSGLYHAETQASFLLNFFKKYSENLKPGVDF